MKNYIVAALAATLSGGVLAAGDAEWNYNLSPYIWFAGMEGDVSPLRNLPPTELDMSAADALDDTESSFMLILDAKRGKNGFYLDLFYSDVHSTENIDAATSTRLHSTTETYMFTAAYAREIANTDHSNLDFITGLRLWSIDAGVSINSQVPELNLSGDNSESWVDPFIGLKGKIAIPDSNFFFTGGVIYGGFNINADYFYEISLNAGYRWTDSLSTLLGYRQYKLDYDQNNFLYDVKQAGWQLGLTWAF